MTRVSTSLFTSILGLLAACSSLEGTESSSLEICDLIQCDVVAPGAPVVSADGTIACTCASPAPTLPSEVCEDGTVAGPTCDETASGQCEWVVTSCPDPQPQDCSANDGPAGQHCEVDCHPCDSPDPKTPCDSFACQSTCVAD